jgi:1,4-alpha-glucan branching enzyme
VRHLLFSGLIHTLEVKFEWDHQRELEWFLLDFDAHAAHQRYVAALNRFYLANPPLYEQDFSPAGFLWIDPDNDAQSVYSYVRTDRAGAALLVVLNFTPRAYTDYRVGVPCAGVYTEVFSSDSLEFGGAGRHNAPIASDPVAVARADHSISLTLPPLCALILSAQ